MIFSGENNGELKNSCKVIPSPSQMPDTVESFTVELLVIVTTVVRGTPLKFAKAFTVICRSFISSVILA